MMRRRSHIVAVLLCLAAVPASAEAGPQPQDGLPAAASPPLLSYAMAGQAQALSPADIREIEVSESGGITDIFVRLQGGAIEGLAQMSEMAVGTTMLVHVCGARLLEIPIDAPILSGTFYIPNTTALQAEGLRAVWHGRATCSDIDPEVFPLAH